MRTILLAVLAIPVVAAVAVLVAIARLARQLERDGVLPNAAPDDSEVVGMPTTFHLKVSPETARTFFAIDWDAFFNTTGRKN